MARKRRRYRYSSRRRPRTPAPKTGWTISELARMTRMPIRRIRYYVEKHFIRPLELRGTATRYPRHDLLRLLAIPLLRQDNKWRLVELERELAKLSGADLERLVLASSLTASAAAALGVPTVQGVQSASSASAASAASSASKVGSNRVRFDGNPTNGTPVVGSLPDASETWQRVSLLPGLEILVSSRASKAVRMVATRMIEECVGAS